MTQIRLNVSSLWFLYFRQERRIACSAEKGERNGEKQQGGYELCKGKKYTVSDVSKAERHNERKNETYENINMIEERIPLSLIHI